MIDSVYVITLLNIQMNTQTIFRYAFIFFLIQDIAKYLQQSICADSRPIKHSEEIPRK